MYLGAGTGKHARHGGRQPWTHGDSVGHDVHVCTLYRNRYFSLLYMCSIVQM